MLIKANSFLMEKIIITSIIFLLSIIQTFASDDNWFFCQKSNQNNGYIVAGAYNVNANPASTIAYTKIDNNGNIVWQKSLSGNTDFIIPYTLNKGQNNYYTCGFSYANGFGAPGDAYVMTFNENGVKQWDWLAGETNGDILYGVCEKNNGEVIVTGYSNSFSTINDLLLIKLSSTGNLLSSKIVYNNTNNNEQGLKVKATADGGYIVMGIIKTGAINDLLLVKYNSSDNISWAKQYGLGVFYDPIDVIEASNGDFIVVGATNIAGSSGNNLLRVSSSGTVLWFKTYSTNILERPSQLLEQNGNIYVSGMVQVPGTTATLDAQYFATDASGNLLFSNKIDVNGMFGKRIGCLETDAINQNEISMVVGEFVSTPRLFDIGIQKVSIHSNSCDNTEYPLTEGTLSVTETNLNLNQQNVNLFEFNGFSTQNINEFSDDYCKQSVFPYFEVDVDPCSGMISTSNLSTNGVSYSWNFGDGNTSTLTNPTHTYSGSGTFTITLFVTDSNGNTDWYDVDVTIPTSTTVSFNLQPIASSNSPITLIASPPGGTFSGIGVVFSAFNPSIAGPGQHDVTYTYTDSNGCTTSVTNSILVFTITYNFVNYSLGIIAP